VDSQHRSGDPLARRPTVAILAAVMTLVLGAAAATLAVRGAGDSRRYDREIERREAFLQSAIAGATAITTVDAAHADADAERVLALSTGEFHDDYQQRAAAFVDSVHKANSTSTATVTAAGIESVDGDEATALVLTSVVTTIPGAPASQPKAWRMRITVRETPPSTMKVSGVELIP
jgi:Mce-associated membrane protein